MKKINVNVCDYEGKDKAVINAIVKNKDLVRDINDNVADYLRAAADAMHETYNGIPGEFPGGVLLDWDAEIVNNYYCRDYYPVPADVNYGGSGYYDVLLHGFIHTGNIIIELTTTYYQATQNVFYETQSWIDKIYG